MKKQIVLDDRKYAVTVDQTVQMPVEAPRLVIVSYMPTRQAREILRVALQAIQHFTPEPHEIWVVDNNSPLENREWLNDYPDINVALNHTEPIPPKERSWLSRKKDQVERGSYANAIALELGARLIHPQSRYFMALHMDTMPCRKGWLSYLVSKLGNGVAAAGVRMDRARTADGVLHVLGYIVDFQLFCQLSLNFFPQLPQYDVGDTVSVNFRKAGYGIFACANTLWQPELTEKIPPQSPLRTLNVDRSFNDDGEVIFLHLGRGVRKSSSDVVKGVTVEEWISFADEYVLS